MHNFFYQMIKYVYRVREFSKRHSLIYNTWAEVISETDLQRARHYLESKLARIRVLLLAQEEEREEQKNMLEQDPNVVCACEVREDLTAEDVSSDNAENNEHTLRVPTTWTRSCRPLSSRPRRFGESRP